MKLDICIPFNRNFRALDMSLRGVAKHTNPSSVNKLLLHIQWSKELDQAVAIAKSHGFNVDVAGISDQLNSVSVYMDRLYASSDADWIVMSEQDLFPYIDFVETANSLDEEGICIAAPMDTFFYDNLNARGRKYYGQYGRLCPEPGYYHSSLMFIKRESLKTKTPFKLPSEFLFMGQGVLGGEYYYGLRVNFAGATKGLIDIGEDRTRLAFFRQLHSDYGYSADIWFKDKRLATHIYYSSHVEMSDTWKGREEEFHWLRAEQERFIDHYNKLTN